MRGDFSAWNKDRSQNFRGTLHQQGRVLLDRDWNAQTEIFNEWQDTAARDIIGPGVAAVPAELPDSFKVRTVTVAADNNIDVTMRPGRVWADGLPLEIDALLAGDDVTRRATYFPAPPGPDAFPGKTDGRDAVILETWLEELSAFQNRDLLEPALGDVDTTERVQTASRLRLFRMSPGDTCLSIIGGLKDDPSKKGKLTAILDPTVTSGGACPVTESGGYTGMEHQLYRIEIAETDRPQEKWFKWSQFNGGLVGTGKFNAGTISIIGNKNAITNAGPTNFYLEVLDLDQKLGHWHVIYGAQVTLDSDTLEVTGTVFLGTFPSSAGGERFFRLWDGIDEVGDFTATPEIELSNGIKLKFDPVSANSNYFPYDFWTFEVRAGDIINPPPLLSPQPPQGIFYHRVPLAEIKWNPNVQQAVLSGDCRRIFTPLTHTGCCTYRVGDGKRSLGDFNSIQDAINALPLQGGTVCILAGQHNGPVVLQNRNNVVLKGCGELSVIVGRGEERVISILDSQNIRIESLKIEAKKHGIYLKGEQNALVKIALSDLYVSTFTKSAIRAQAAQSLSIRNSRIIYVDGQDQEVHPVVYLSGQDILIEGCEILVAGDQNFKPDRDKAVLAKTASGGLQIGAGSERVRIIDNVISGGVGNGIALGSVGVFDGNGQVIRTDDPGLPQLIPFSDFIDENTLAGIRLAAGLQAGLKPAAGPPITDVLIKSNRISHMGRSGIGAVYFFQIGDNSENLAIKIKEKTPPRIVSVDGLEIIQNRIEECARDSDRLRAIPPDMLPWMGRGGIALARVEDLFIRDNFITGNGGKFERAACGIFVLDAEGVEISRNQIHGPVNGDINSLQDGARGGIWIKSADSPSLDGYKSQYYQGRERAFRGAPAVTIQDNVVSVQVGRSLTLGATGEVLVTNNRFTTFEPDWLNPAELLVKLRKGGKKPTGDMVFELNKMIAGNVLIFDLSLMESLQPVVRSLLGMDGIDRARNKRTEAMLKKLELARSAAAKKRDEIKDAQSPIFTGQQAAAAVDRDPDLSEPFFTDSNFLFSGNQCFQDRKFAEDKNTEKDEFLIASIVVANANDVGFNDNYSGCRLQQSVLPVVNTYIAAMSSSRTNSNRFAETIARDLLGEKMPAFPLSAITYSDLNITTSNIATHCIVARTSGNGLIFDSNLIRAEHLRRELSCEKKMDRELKGPFAEIVNQVAELLMELFAKQVRDDIEIKQEKHQLQLQKLESYLTKFGQDDPNTKALKKSVDMEEARLKSAVMVHSAAIMPLGKAENGWAVDGFIREPDGDPAVNVTVAAYDKNGLWRKEFGHTGTDEKGHFSLMIEKLGDKPEPVFLRASLGERFLKSPETKVAPEKGISDRVDITIGEDLKRVDFPPPPGEKVDPKKGPKPAPPPKRK